MNVGNCIFLKLYLAMVEIWIPHKVWAAILSYDLTSSLGWDNSFHMSNSVASQRHLATSLWNLKRDEGGIGLQQEKHFSRLFFPQHRIFVRLLRGEVEVGCKRRRVEKHSSRSFPFKRHFISDFSPGGQVVGCRCEETRQLALHWGDRGCTSHWRLEGDDCYKMQLRETLVFCLASRRQGLQGGDSSHWWRHTPVIQIGTPLAVGSHWCYRMQLQAQVENGKLAFCLGDTSVRVNCPRLQPGDTFQTFIGTDFTSDWDALAGHLCEDYGNVKMRFKKHFPQKEKMFRQIWQYITHKSKTNGIIVVALRWNIFCEINVYFLIFCSGDGNLLQRQSFYFR